MVDIEAMKRVLNTRHCSRGGVTPLGERMSDATEFGRIDQCTTQIGNLIVERHHLLRRECEPMCVAQRTA